MPIYVYETIEKSGGAVERFERLEALGSAPLTEHPVTGAPVRRVIANVAKYAPYGGLSDSVVRAAAGGAHDAHARTASSPSSCCAGGSCAAHKG